MENTKYRALKTQHTIFLAFFRNFYKVFEHSKSPQTGVSQFSTSGSTIPKVIRKITQNLYEAIFSAIDTFSVQPSHIHLVKSHRCRVTQSAQRQFLSLSPSPVFNKT